MRQVMPGTRSSGTATTNQQPAEHPASDGEQHVHIAIIGTGFSGLGMAIKLRQRGEEDFVLLERADDVGGTWRDNTYPGCACDVPSHLYSFSFAPNPDWSHVYSPQPEIWEYMRRCTERYGIGPHIRWHTELVEAAWDEQAQRWRLTTNQGQLTADLLIAGQGPLSEPSLPAIPGIERFAGTIFHTAQWNHEHDLSGERVAIIGTGASAIQVVPNIQPRVGHLALFQRTPPWIVPRLDHPIADWRRAVFHTLPFTQAIARSTMYWQRELIALGMVYRQPMLKKAEQIALRHLAAQVKDPALRERLTPNYRMGCKRILSSDVFYPALTQPNVELVTEGIREIRAQSIVTVDGQEREIDTLICATGFHVTDMPIAQQIFGCGQQSLAEAWGDGVQAYLGTTVVGFPNLFLLIGPNTGLGHTSMIYMIESQLAYLMDGLRQMERRHVQTVEVRPEVQAAYNAEVQRRLATTIWASGCRSWYLDAHGRNSTIWPGFTFEFRRKTRHFDPEQYILTARTATVPQRP